MDDGPVRYLIAFIFLFVISAYFAATEIALSSVNKIRMSVNAENGSKSAKRVLYILDNFDKAITTLLIGNNVAHMAIATLATLLTYDMFKDAGSLPEYALALCTVITSVLVFFAGEMIPKSFAKACSDKFSMIASGPLVFLMYALTPVSFVFSALSRTVSKPLKKMAMDEPTVTEDELYDIIETYVEENDIDEDTEELVQNAIEFSESTVKDVMTPWNKVIKVNIDDSPESIKRVIQEQSYSRMPVLDNYGKVIGTLRTRSFLKEYIKDRNVCLKNIINTPEFIPENTLVDDLLTTMSGKRTHIAYVGSADSVAGIITVEDILEELVGEIYDEADDESDGLGGDDNA